MWVEPEAEGEEEVDEKAAPSKTAGAASSAAAKPAAPAKVGMLRGLFNSIVGKKVLTREDLTPVLETFRQTYDHFLFFRALAPVCCFCRAASILLRSALIDLI
jgi:hypothetical protein